MVVREKVKLIEKVSDVDTAERIHLRKGKYVREAVRRYQPRLVTEPIQLNSLDLFSLLVGRIPANVNDLVIFIDIVDRHWHVIIGGYDLR